MLDFLKVQTKTVKRGSKFTELIVYPTFLIKKSTDLMIRGRDFYAIWDEETSLWSTEEDEAVRLIDAELRKYAEEKKAQVGDDTIVSVNYMIDASSGSIDSWHKYVQKQCRDNYKNLDDKIIFADSKPSKADYATKRLSYPLQDGDLTAYNELIGTLYSKEERRKIEWAIGAVVSGDSKFIQKFLVFYGAAGTGKSTILNIIQKLFDGYYCIFDSKALGSANDTFALEAFKSNPLVAIQHDGDLSRIEDNTRLNSLVSHEEMTVNEKFKSTYTNRFRCMLFMGTNKPVKITDGRSGLLRRLIDVSPTGNTLPSAQYKRDMKEINFELGAIAKHCLRVYQQNPERYDDYVPMSMLDASNDFYNYIVEEYDKIRKVDGIALSAAWEDYKKYCDDAKVPYPYTRRVFKEEMKNYFKEFKNRYTFEGTTYTAYYIGFLSSKIGILEPEEPEAPKIFSSPKSWIDLEKTVSLFDEVFKDCPAQYANSKGNPEKPWSKVTTTLKDLDTTKLHWVNIPEELNVVTMDFDLKDISGNKCRELNIEAASKFPSTYAEYSKGGEGIHLEYFYAGDANTLAKKYAEDIEVKVYKGGSALRRRLSFCNDIPIATITSGLPLAEKKRKGDSMVNQNTIESESHLRTLIRRAMLPKDNPKRINPEGTKPAVDFIFHVLEEAYKNPKLTFDVSDVHSKVMAFALNSTNNSDYCVDLVSKMHFTSKNLEGFEDIGDPEVSDDDTRPIAIFDIEVFKNVLIICLKELGDDKEGLTFINPAPEVCERIINSYRLIGFNNKEYDNHIIYARKLGYTNYQLYDLSQHLIGTGKDKWESKKYKFKVATNLSYTDILDFAASKKSLKKYQIEMQKEGMIDVHHQENAYDWDEPLDPSHWDEVAQYCMNDVKSTEKLFYYLHGDFEAREFLAKLATVIGGVPSTVNDSTNNLSARLIFGKNMKPQGDFKYRNLAEKSERATWCYKDYLAGDPKANVKYGMPYYPGYTFELKPNAKGELKPVSSYRGEEIGEGGKVFADPGMYLDGAQTEDIASQYPTTIDVEDFLGEGPTAIYRELKALRVDIKHRDFDSARKRFNGAIADLIDERSAKALAQALKIVLNSAYGETKASFPNRFRTELNKDNFVAKRGSLFMTDLKFAVQDLGYHVIHIKTDSIKVEHPDEFILKFIRDMGAAYGYTFETEAKFEKLCLVNDAVYIAKCTEDSPEDPGEWTATGTQFQIPYVFKTLFSHEPLEFDDYATTISTAVGALYLDMNETLVDGEHNLKDISTDSEYEETIDHQYEFIGRVSSFVPVKPGCGGGELFVKNKKTGKFSSPAGTKRADGSRYRFLETEYVRNLPNRDEIIDLSYWEKMAEDAVATISKFGDFNTFVDTSFDGAMNPPEI